jgi:hypothetical protein
MTDARLPERWLNDRRVIRLTDGAFRTFVTSLVWSVANRTDGVIDPDDLDLVHGASRDKVPELVAAGLYEPAGSVHLIVDFAATQTSRDELRILENVRRQDREKKARQRARKSEESEHLSPQGVGKVRNVGLDLRRWQSAARVQTQSLLSGSLPARSRLSSRPGQRGLAVPLPAIRRHSARNCHVSTGASAQLKRLVSDFVDPLGELSGLFPDPCGGQEHLSTALRCAGFDCRQQVRGECRCRSGGR